MAGVSLINSVLQDISVSYLAVGVVPLVEKTVVQSEPGSLKEFKADLKRGKGTGCQGDW